MSGWAPCTCRSALFLVLASSCLAQGQTLNSLSHLQKIQVPGDPPLVKDLKFTHLTTNDGLSQGYVTAILQDRQGFMWFATRDGLNRYDGNTFVVYKHNPNDPLSLSSNFIQDLIEDDRGYLWAATNVGLNRFDPRTERVTRYLHDPNSPHSFGGVAVKSIVQDTRGHFWIGTEDSGLDELDPATETFTHYRNDSDGQFVGRITRVIAANDRDVWFAGERGLFHLDPQTGEITRPTAIENGYNAESACKDEAGDLWMLTYSPVVGLVKYDRQAERFSKYPLDAHAGIVVNGSLSTDGTNGLWVPTSQGLYYFDRRTERFTYRFRHEESNPNSLDSNAVLSIYQDRGGLLWMGTENAGLNILDLQQEQFVHYRHRPADPNSLSLGRVKAIYEDANGILWVGLFPRALDRLDRNTGKITHYIAGPADESSLGAGVNVTSIYKDAAGRLWVGGGGSGLVRFDERTRRFKHYRHKPDDPNSLLSDNVFAIYGDRNGHMWVGQQGGLSRFDPATDRFNNFQPVPNNPASLANSVWVIHQDRSGALWLGTWGGELIRFDHTTNTFVSSKPDSRDSHKLNGAGITSIHEDRTGTLWVGTFDGLYRHDRQRDSFTRYTESQGLPSSSIRCIQEDGSGRLWLSTQKGVSLFDPKLESFRNYDVSDGLQSDEFSDGCYQSHDGEIFFGGSNGFNAFFPERVRDNPYVPPVVITNFTIFNKPVAIGPNSVLEKAIPYVDSVALSYRDNVFSFEFAALSYAQSNKNRYRFKLENFERDWNEVGSKQRLATYTNLDPGKYVFRVQGSNSDGVWNEEGASLAISITPPWWGTWWFRGVCAVVLLMLAWAAYRLRIRQLQREFKKLQDVIEAIPGYVWSALPDGSVDFINRRWLDFSGFSLEQALGWGWAEAVHPEDRDHCMEAWRAAFAAGQPMEAEARVRRADGQYRWLLIRNVPLHDKAGKVLKWYGKSTDIDDRKRAEQALRRSEAYLADAQRLTGTGAWASDSTTRPLYWSDEVFRIFGFDREQGLPSAELPLQRVHPEDRDKFWRAFQGTIQEKVDSELEYRIVLPDGTVKHVHALAHPVVSPDQELVEVVGTIVDVTDRKRAEEERERLRRIEADLAHINRVSIMGELAASIAHEVNQPLSGIVSNGSACLRWLAGDKPDMEEVREAVGDIVRDGKRAGEVIARIRALTKRAAMPSEKVDLNETIAEVLALVGDEAKSMGAVIRTDFADDLSPVSGDRVQLQQIVLNLVMNGIEAMSGVDQRARELVITTRNIDPDQVQVSVADSGPGLDPNTASRIFEPFYTTKASGMGMGLSISRSIVENHGGRLWATANDGPGTSFHFSLPKYED